MNLHKVYCFVPRDISVPMQSFLLTLFLFATQTYFAMTAPVKATTNFIQLRPQITDITETDESTSIQVSKNPNNGLSKAFEVQNQHKTYSRSSKLNSTNYLSQQQNTSALSTSSTLSALSGNVNKYSHTILRNSSSLNKTISFPTIISKTNTSSNELLITQKSKNPSILSVLKTEAEPMQENKAKNIDRRSNIKSEQKSPAITNTFTKESNLKNSTTEQLTNIKKTSSISFDQIDSQKQENVSALSGLSMQSPSKLEPKLEEKTNTDGINRVLHKNIDLKSIINTQSYTKKNNTISFKTDSSSKMQIVSNVSNQISVMKSVETVNEQPKGNKKTTNSNKFKGQAGFLSKNTNATLKSKNRSKENSIYPKDTWQLQNKVTLKPIQNGFLGPIHMDEKVFSAIHKGKENDYLHSHIRDEKYVEIIAPKHQNENEARSRAEAESTSTTFHTAQEENNPPLLSSTVFQVPDSQTSTTHIPSSTQFQSSSYDKQNKATTPLLLEIDQQTESKISDIQIEVYDSTIDSIISSTNFKEGDDLLSSYMQSALSATKPPALSTQQDKFTQYVIDHVDSSTEKSNLLDSAFAAGVPEPAAIEIHINVSEGHGNESEDLEFSYRQQENVGKSGKTDRDSFIKEKSPDITFKANTPGPSSGEQSDEILVVEVIDSGDNITENSASFENIDVNPIITFCSDTVKHVVSKNSFHKSENRKVSVHSADDLFMPHERNYSPPNIQSTVSPVAPLWNKKHVSDRDSDTIFYISNTEVKVGESLPTSSPSMEQQLRKSRLENQFFPVSYMSSTHPNVNLNEQHRYEEDILLSPMYNTPNFVKIIRTKSENSPPLDVTYVGESIMEVEQSSGSMPTSSFSSPFPLKSRRPDVIIQPAILPEISIGVPIIGELPPQIELKEIDYMPSDEGDNDSHENDVETIVESSIQYGGDLIDEGGVINGGGFDGIEGSYPFANPAFVKPHSRIGADFSDIYINSHMSNLKKDDLIADVSGSVEISLQNGTITEKLRTNESDLDGIHSENYTTSYQPNSIEDAASCFSDIKTLFFAWFFTLLPLLVIVCAAFAIGYIYRKHRADGKNGEDIFNDEDISRDTRETKMHYSNTEKDGIFVVEVARGIDSKSMQDSPVSRTNQNLLPLEQAQNRPTVEFADHVDNPAKNHEEVQIHQPPHEKSNSIITDELQMALHQIEEVDEPIHLPNSKEKQVDVSDFKYGRSSNTGLSQSDLSSTSSSDSNKRYSYGNQELYTTEKPVFCPLLPVIQSPMQTAERDADDDHQSENGQSTIQSPTKLERVTNGHNGTRGNEMSTNADKQINITLSMKHHEGTSSSDRLLSHGVDQNIIASIDVLNSVIVPNGSLIVENCFENIESHCNGYDSMMSLPDPPSIEEMKHLSECDFIESNQLDSLPPPPPPNQMTLESRVNDNLQENTLSCMQHKDLQFGSSIIEHENDLKFMETATEFSHKNSISPAPLTPPASPPHYTNGGKGIATNIAVAVNVNSS